MGWIEQPTFTETHEEYHDALPLSYIGIWEQMELNHHPPAFLTVRSTVELCSRRRATATAVATKRFFLPPFGQGGERFR